MFFRKFLAGFIQLFYPRTCAVCHSDLMVGEEVMCLTCLYALPLTRFWNQKDNPVAKVFWGRVPVENACAYFLFAKGSKYRPLLHMLKYKGRRDIGVELGRQFGLVLKSSELYHGVDYVIPVPLHKRKLKIRGYNQAQAIAEGICQTLGAELSINHLIRTEFTETQTRKTRAERVQNVAQAFSVVNSDDFTGKHLLIVDDVVTTGATLEACAAKLIEAANCKVSVGALAYASS
ncbi:ComF family protein [Perlabentimonas gracilis]|uniref:ComF family protein n=1 Tax=Perlabentimonas gracilis TaxID=2715279 RepID=UPI00140AE78F|nr:phosphoribosyltransferase family protein [Perlabentimonas gracilis]NHB69012.1 ComF family protein [Perlabentimonas gracilis]